MAGRLSHRVAVSLPGTARRLLDAPRQGLTTVLGAPQQVSALWEDVTALLRRAGQLLDRAELIVARLEHKLDELDALTETTSQVVGRAAEVTAYTDTLSHQARDTRQRAEEQVGRMEHLLDTYQPLLESLAPLGREAASTLRPDHVRAMVSLLDKMPDLVGLLQPALDGMGGLLPHLQDVTERMDTVGQVVEGLPGARTLRRRGQARDDDADD